MVNDVEREQKQLIFKNNPKHTESRPQEALLRKGLCLLGLLHSENGFFTVYENRCCCNVEILRDRCTDRKHKIYRNLDLQRPSKVKFLGNKYSFVKISEAKLGETNLS